MKQADFHVLRESQMDAILTENGFIDNAADAAMLKDPDVIDQLARGHALGIVAAFQLQGKQTSTEPSKPSEPLEPSQPETSLQSGLFIVQIGAFEDPSNAEKTALQATEKGFDTFIKQEDNLYKVQIGAFKERINAEELVQEASAAGLTAVITLN